MLIHCQYDYPPGHNVMEIMWCQHDSDCIQTTYVCHSENFSLTEAKRRPGQSENMEPNSHKAECLGDKKKNCTLKITNTRITDAGVYRFRFKTNVAGGDWTGQPGLMVSVHGKTLFLNHFCLAISSYSKELLNVSHAQRN